MNLLPLVTAALGVVLIPIAIALQRRQAGRARGRLHERCRDLIAGAETLDVGWWTSELFASAAGQRTPLPGLLVFAADELRLIGLEPVSERTLLRRFPLTHSRVALFDAEALLGPGTAVLRLHDGSDGIALLWQQAALRGGGAAATRELFERIRRRIQRDPASEDAKPRSLAARIGRFTVLLIVLLASVALLVHVGVSHGPRGPQQVRVAADGSVFAFTPTMLLGYERDGSGERAWPLAGLGIGDGLTALQALDHDTVLLGDYQSGRILRCDLRGPSCTPLPQADGRYQRAFKFLLAADGRTLWVSDTARDRLLRTDIDGKAVQALTAPGGLCFPNALVPGDDGSVLLADTNHFRVIDWSADGRFQAAHAVVAGEPVAARCRSESSGHSVPSAWLDRDRRYAQSERPTALPGLGADAVWVTDLTRSSDGHWWLVLNGDNLRRGQLVRFDADFSHPRPVVLPRGAEPWSVAARGDDVLLADPAGAALLRFDAEGRARAGVSGPVLAAQGGSAPRLGRDDPWMLAFGAGVIGLLLVLLPFTLIRSRRHLRRILST